MNKTNMTTKYIGWVGIQCRLLLPNPRILTWQLSCWSPKYLDIILTVQVFTSFVCKVLEDTCRHSSPMEYRHHSSFARLADKLISLAMYHGTRSGDGTITDWFPGGCNPGLWGHIPGRGTAEDSCSLCPNYLLLFLWYACVYVCGEKGGGGRRVHIGRNWGYRVPGR